MNRAERRAQERRGRAEVNRKRYLLGKGFEGRTPAESAELAALVAEWEEQTDPYTRMAVEDSTNDTKGEPK